LSSVAKKSKKIIAAHLTLQLRCFAMSLLLYETCTVQDNFLLSACSSFLFIRRFSGIYHELDSLVLAPHYRAREYIPKKKAEYS
jgi:hypothetical protein